MNLEEPDTSCSDRSLNLLPIERTTLGKVDNPHLCQGIFFPRSFWSFIISFLQIPKSPSPLPPNTHTHTYREYLKSKSLCWQKNLGQIYCKAKPLFFSTHNVKVHQRWPFWVEVWDSCKLLERNSVRFVSSSIFCRSCQPSWMGNLPTVWFLLVLISWGGHEHRPSGLNKWNV